jgi:glycerol-3-phosphate dehydrogenase (NAD(P)+)
MKSEQKTSVGVLGAGAWGTAIAKVLVEKGCRVDLWSFESDLAAEINTVHRNDRYLIGAQLPEELLATGDICRAAADKDYLLLAVPSIFIVDTVKKILHSEGIMEGRTHIGILSKGFINTADGIKLVAGAIEDCLPECYKDNLVYISGPSHAEEVARGKITGLISASANGTNAIRFRELLSSQQLVVFSSLDIRGVQIGAAMKNVVAIAFGMLDALSEFSENIGDNTESLLLAAGLNEIQQLGVAMGATHLETFSSIAGVGDLDVTCRSKYGRNRRFGREIVIDHRLSSFKKIDDVIDRMPEMGYFAEGVVASKHVKELAQLHYLSLPVCESVYRILNREIEPLNAIEDLLSGMRRAASSREI